jgi:transposase
MITPPAGVRVYLACGSTDMRKGMATLAMLVQQTLGHDPFCGTVYAFRGRRTRPVHLADVVCRDRIAYTGATLDAARRMRVAGDGAQSAT